jgi:hypothetical protein
MNFNIMAFEGEPPDLACLACCLRRVFTVPVSGERGVPVFQPFPSIIPVPSIIEL